MPFGFKYILFSEDFTPFLAVIPEVLISVVPSPCSPSEWRQSDLLKPKFHHVSAAYTPVVIPYLFLVKMLNVL